MLLFTLISHATTYGCYHSSGSYQPHLRDEDSKKAESPVRSWLNRRACNWLGACELGYLWNKASDGLIKGADKQTIFSKEGDTLDKVRTRSENSRNGSGLFNDIPQYVLDYAPLVYLHSEEKFWPCDMAEHLIHVTPELNYTQIQSRTQNLALTNLDELNEWDRGRFVYLTSNDNVEELPDWLGGEKNIPNIPEKADEQFNDDDFLRRQENIENRAESFRHKMYPQEDPEAKYRRSHDRTRSRFKLSSRWHSVNKDEAEKFQGRDTAQMALAEIERRQLAGRSDAPAVLIVVQKGGGIVDAFWFFFYSYNLGNSVFDVRFGNHVGDWEHTLIRFQDGKPKYVFFSEHNFGEAYSYGAVEKIGKRVSSICSA